MCKFSIITVVYNDKEGLVKTIKSVLSQSFLDFEYIVIDGASTDGTIDFIRQYESGIKKWITEPDKGIYDAMNKGIFMASGEWIIFMNAGDEFVSDHTLQEVIDHIKDDNLENFGVIYGDCIFVTSIAEKYGKAWNPFFKQKKYIPEKGFCHQSSFVRNELAKNNNFDLKYKICGDFYMMWNIYKQGYMFKHVPMAIAKYEVENGASKKHPIKAFKENAEVVGRNRTILFYIILCFFSISQFSHDILSVVVRNLFPNLFYYIKKKRL